MDQPYIWVDHLPACALLASALLVAAVLIRKRNRSRR